MAEQLRSEILSRNEDIGRKALRQCTFGQNWVTQCIKWHSEVLQNSKAKSVELLRFVCCNVQTVSKLFAEVQYVFEKYKINPSQIMNLDETGYATGRKNAAKI